MKVIQEEIFKNFKQDLADAVYNESLFGLINSKSADISDNVVYFVTQQSYFHKLDENNFKSQLYDKIIEELRPYTVRYDEIAKDVFTVLERKYGENFEIIFK